MEVADRKTLLGREGWLSFSRTFHQNIEGIKALPHVSVLWKKTAQNHLCAAPFMSIHGNSITSDTGSHTGL